MKKEGKWLSKKDLIKKKAAEARLKQMVEAGIITESQAAADADGDNNNEEKKGGAMVRKKKNKNKDKDAGAAA